MTTVVTGGAGFIGSELCKQLAQRGDDVVVVDNLSTGKREWLNALGPRVVLIEADIRDAPKMREVLLDVRPQAVCHLAAIHFIPTCNEHPAEALAVNVIGTQNVLEACKAAAPEKVLLASTAAVYGINDRPNREEDTPQPLDVYGISKHACEQLGRAYSAQAGSACISARISNAVGRNETNPHLVPHLVGQLRNGSREVSLGNLDPRRDYIDTRDLAAGLISLLALELHGHAVFNIGSGREYSVRELVEMCESILGRAITIAQQPHLVRKVERLHLCANIEKIRGATGWRPTIAVHETLRYLLLE